MWYLLDGTPIHRTALIYDYLDKTFPDRWIGKGDPFRWPPQPPDLTKLHVFLWGFVKNQVYRRPPKIVLVCSLIILICNNYVIDRSTQIFRWGKFISGKLFVSLYLLYLVLDCCELYVFSASSLAPNKKIKTTSSSLPKYFFFQ